MYNTIGAYTDSSGEGCVITGTRAELLALASSGSLSLGCHYELIGFTQGRLVAGTTILLHAVSCFLHSKGGRIVRKVSGGCREKH